MMATKTFRLDNGLRVSFIPKKGYKHTVLTMVVPFGSVHRTFRSTATTDDIKTPAGLAHFLEHLVFEASGMNTHVLSSGAEASALTTHDMTIYELACTDSVQQHLSFLVKGLTNLSFSDALVEKERQVIQSEIDLFQEDFATISMQQWTEGMYGSMHPLSVDIAGTTESVKQIQRQQLEHAYHTFYQPEHMQLLIVGDIEASIMIQTLESLGVSKTEHQTSYSICMESASTSKKVSPTVLHLPVPVPFIRWGYREQNVTFEQMCVAQVTLATLFGKHTSFVQRGIADEWFAQNFHYDYRQHLAYGYGTIAGYVFDLETFYDHFEKYIERVRHRGVTQAELVDGKKEVISYFFQERDVLRRFSLHTAAYQVKGYDFESLIPTVEKIELTQVQSYVESHMNAKHTHAVHIFPLEHA
ncbi:insulinase family protein [Hazenella sp. IB182357]|uniref:Insulinase family protein n=1 Tax=Polycladospora coralii TaxID=2771432 RepID=A0A926NGE4_9BACL|nr:pitrilysin family protein [Polycladospora coralii]MBD1372858.1 insulinase family protein [Polycladospora coralii]